MDRLDVLPDAGFTVVLYILRWLVILPLAGVISLLTDLTESDIPEIHPAVLMVGMVVLGPMIETLIECTVPYLVMNLIKRRAALRWWSFVVVSAVVMGVLHLVSAPAVVFALITGAFLAYTYQHFAPRGHLRAFAHTTAFHAAINIVGFTMFAMSS